MIIKNGNLGLSSHHGIHSNNATRVVIQDLNFFDFEMIGIAFNGFFDIEITNVNIGPTFKEVPLTGHHLFSVVSIAICF